MRSESNTKRHPAPEPPSPPYGAEGMLHVRERSLILPVAAFFAILLSAGCSFDAKRLRALQLADSGAREADARVLGAADARDQDAKEVDALLDHPLEQDLGVKDSSVEVGADRATARPEVGDVSEARGSEAGDGDAPADLLLEAGDWFDAAVEAVAVADAGATDSRLGSDGATATGGADGGFDTAGDVAGDGRATDGKLGSDGGTGGTNGSFDAGGDVTVDRGAADGTPGFDGFTATGGTDGTFDAAGNVPGDGGPDGIPGSDGATAAGGTDGSFDAVGDFAGDKGAADGMPGSDDAPAAGGTDGSVSLPAGLVAWWKMDEAAGNDTASDASGNGNHAALTGLDPASAWTTGRTGGALKCDGSGSALVNQSISLDGITTGVTVSAWVNRLSATTGFTAILSRETGTTNSQYYWLGLSGDKAEFYGSAGVLSTTTVPIGIWTHLAATDDGSTARVYVNGSQVTSKSVSDVFRVDASKLVICGNQNDASGTVTQLWNGLVDDLQLYNRVLTATEIANLAK